LDVQSLRGANADADHYLLIVGLSGRIARMTDSRITKIGSKYGKR
jgi:hypothetical protein